MEKYRKLDLFILELGSDLCLEKTLDEILKAIPFIREETFAKYGVVIPNVRIKENKTLKPLEYVIKVNGYAAGRFEFKKNSILILDTGFVKTKMTGKPAKEPVFGDPGLWITKGKRAVAEQNGYVVLSVSKIIKVHLTEKIKENLLSVITTQYVGELFEEIIKENQFLCQQLVNKYGNALLPVVKKVLCMLLEERVSIRNFLTILETISNEQKFDILEVPHLVNTVRCSIIPDIIESLGQKNNEIEGILLSRKLSDYLFKSKTINQEFLFDRATDKIVIGKFLAGINEMKNQCFEPVIFCIESLRYSVKKYLEEYRIQNVHVISEKEMSAAVRKMNISIQILKTIGEDFDPPVVKEAETSVHKKSIETLHPEQKPKSDFAKLKQNLGRIIEKMNTFEQRVISMRFGLGEEHSHSLEEVAQAFDISSEKIRTIEVKALLLLRKHTGNEE